MSCYGLPVVETYIEKAPCAGNNGMQNVAGMKNGKGACSF